MSVSATHQTPATPAVVRLIRLDAVLSGASGVLLAGGSSWLDETLGVSTPFLVGVGIFLLAYAAALVVLARTGAPARAVWGVVAGNTVWAIASVVVVVTDALSLTTEGTVVTLVQAAAVMLLADLQLLAARRAR